MFFCQYINIALSKQFEQVVRNMRIWPADGTPLVSLDTAWYFKTKKQKTKQNHSFNLI